MKKKEEGKTKKNSSAWMLYYAMIFEIIVNIFSDTSNAGILFDMLIELFSSELAPVEILGVSTSLTLPGLVLGSAIGAFAAIEFSLARLQLNEYHLTTAEKDVSSPKVTLVSDEENALLDAQEEERKKVLLDEEKEGDTTHYQEKQEEKRSLTSTSTTNNYNTLTPETNTTTLLAKQELIKLSLRQKLMLAGFSISSLFDNTALPAVVLKSLATRYSWPPYLSLSAQALLLLCATPSTIPATQSCADSMRMLNQTQEKRKDKNPARLFQLQDEENSLVTSPHP